MSPTRPPGPRHAVREALRGQTFLVAGGTGFLGKVFLALLLQHIPDSRVILLVRARGGVPAGARVAQLLLTSPAFRALRTALGAHFVAEMRARVSVVPCDLLRERPQLSPEVLAQVDCTVNLSGDIEFAPDPGRAVAVNVRGALGLADLAARTPTRRLIHVSTCYVSGPGQARIPEAPLQATPSGAPLDGAAALARLEALAQAVDDASERVRLAQAQAQALGWPNTYTFTKALAEQALQARDDLHLTVVRPSIIESALEAPFSGWNEGLKTTAPMLYLMLSGMWRVPADPGLLFDVVPVDEAARGVLLACARGASGAVWHLASSTVAPVTIGRFAELSLLGALKHGAPGGRDMRLRAVQPRMLGCRDESPLAPEALLRWVRWGRQQLPAAAGDALKGTERLLQRAERVVSLLEPFLLHHGHRYVAQHALEASARLPATEQATLGLRLPDLDWRDYIVERHYPGIQRWCFPRFDGQEVPADPPPPDAAALVLGGPPVRRPAGAACA